MKQIMNLKSAALSASGLKLDHRFKVWVRFVERVDTSKTDGYAFIGDFVNDGTVEVEVAERLLLCMAESGSQKYHLPWYAIVKMDAAGELRATDITTNGRQRGWALRIRDDVVDLLTAVTAVEEK